MPSPTGPGALREGGAVVINALARPGLADPARSDRPLGRATLHAVVPLQQNRRYFHDRVDRAIAQAGNTGLASASPGYSPIKNVVACQLVISIASCCMNARNPECMPAPARLTSSAHSDDLRISHIDADGIQVGARLADEEGLLSGRPTRKRQAEGPPQ